MQRWHPEWHPNWMQSIAPKKPQAPIRNRQTRKVANAKVLNRQMTSRPIIYRLG